MTMRQPKGHKHAWFALADAESCRLLRCSLTRQGTPHVEEYGALQNTLPEPEHMRPTIQGDTTRHLENKERRFAGQIVEWLQTQARQREIVALTMFVPPRMLGVLRMIPLGALQGHVEELRGDLMRLNAGQLADHQMVRELVTPPPNDE